MPILLPARSGAPTLSPALQLARERTPPAARNEQCRIANSSALRTRRTIGDGSASIQQRLGLCSSRVPPPFPGSRRGVASASWSAGVRSGALAHGRNFDCNRRSSAGVYEVPVPRRLPLHRWRLRSVERAPHPGGYLCTDGVHDTLPEFGEESLFPVLRRAQLDSPIAASC
jgi:hypothetical protein